MFISIIIIIIIITIIIIVIIVIMSTLKYNNHESLQSITDVCF